jgi:hypothetical protein
VNQRRLFIGIGVTVGGLIALVFDATSATAAPVALFVLPSAFVVVGVVIVARIDESDAHATARSLSWRPIRHEVSLTTQIPAK